MIIEGQLFEKANVKKLNEMKHGDYMNLYYRERESNIMQNLPRNIITLSSYSDKERDNIAIKSLLRRIMKLRAKKICRMVLDSHELKESEIKKLLDCELAFYRKIQTEILSYFESIHPV